MLNDWKEWSKEKLSLIFNGLWVCDPVTYGDEVTKELQNHSMCSMPSFSLGYAFCLGMAYGKHVERLRRRMSKREFQRRHPTVYQFWIKKLAEERQAASAELPRR